MFTSAVVLLCATVPAVAQDACFPADDSNEARTMAIVAVPLAFTASGSNVPGRISVGVEAATLPTVPDAVATPTTCRPGKGPENANPLPGFARVRIAAAVGPWRMELGWIPPVRVEQVRANLVGIGIERYLPVGGAWFVVPRVHALLGALRAPVTCDDRALRDPSSECFEGTRSDDRLRPGVFGIETRIARHGRRVSPHAGVGYSHLRPRFQVDFTNAMGMTDRRRVSVELDRLALFGGVSLAAGSWTITTEAYGTLGDRLAARAVVRHALAGW